MKQLTQLIKNKYYRYQPGEFFPVYSDGELQNRREFHAYRIKWILHHREDAIYQFTHHVG